MPAAITDKFADTYNAANPNVARVTSTRSAAGTSLSCDNLSGWPTGTVVHFSTYRLNTSNAVVAGTQIDWVGIVSGSTIGSLTRITGATDNGSAVGDVVEMNPTAKWASNLVNGILVSHNQDGTLKNNAVTTAVITDSNVTTAKLANGAVTNAKLDSDLAAGWVGITGSISAVTYNGNRSYSLTTSSDNSGVISPGMRLRTTRTVSAPTQVASLNGTNNYFSKSSPAGMTFTDDFVASAWVKLTSYPGTDAGIVSRYNGTSGWILGVKTTGQIFFSGYNGGAANNSQVISYQSLPLNKWVHVTGQLDMSSFTATSTTSYVMLDGTDVPVSVSRGGTNPTALVQAGNLEVGTYNAGGFFPGKIAQVAVFNAKVTQATIRGYISQGLSGSETSLISAYSFNNSITDLNTTNANNLTNNNSTSITNADSPFGCQADGTISATKDYAIVQTVSASTLVVQVPEGCTIPTSGGVSACSYSSFKNPYGFPGQKEKFRLSTLLRTISVTTSNATYGSFISGGYALTAPIGAWDIGYQSGSYFAINVETTLALSNSALTGLTIAQANAICRLTTRLLASTASAMVVPGHIKQGFNLSSQSTFVMYSIGTTTSNGIDGGAAASEIFAENAYL